MSDMNFIGEKFSSFLIEPNIGGSSTLLFWFSTTVNFAYSFYYENFLRTGSTDFDFTGRDGRYLEFGLLLSFFFFDSELFSLYESVYWLNSRDKYFEKKPEIYSS
jgi:hypothetical protein